MMRFPIATLIRFCHNHGLLQVANRPQWYTVHGGSREYVRRIVAMVGDARLHAPVRAVIPLADGQGGVMVHTDAGAERFDEVVLATHADTSLKILGAAASAEQREVLSAVRYHDNVAVLHTDTSVLPQRKAWAAWNYERAALAQAEDRAVCLHYLINRLQPLPWTQPVIVSLNPLHDPKPESVLARFDYAHPVFDQAAMDAQHRLPALQGQHGVWLAGAWTGYGFHEDGLKSGLAVAAGLLAKDGVTLADDAQALAARYLQEARLP